VLDLSAKRALNRGAGEALSVAVELAVTPAIFAWAGWRLDIWLGTGPVFLIGLFLFTFGYCVWKQVRAYELRMRAEQDAVPGLARRGTGDEA
jgi:F0F1-type ATP synthase assembly protein I